MNRTIWLSLQYDLDLIALASCPGFNIGYWIREVLRAAAHNAPLDVPMPEIPPQEPVIMESRCVSFYLNETKDADVINYIRSFREGFQNCAIKHVFRQYLPVAFILPYYEGSPFIPRFSRASKGHSVKRKQDYPETAKQTVKAKRGTEKRKNSFNNQMNNNYRQQIVSNNERNFSQNSYNAIVRTDQTVSSTPQKQAYYNPVNRLESVSQTDNNTENHKSKNVQSFSENNFDYDLKSEEHKSSFEPYTEKVRETNNSNSKHSEIESTSTNENEDDFDLSSALGSMMGEM